MQKIDVQRQLSEILELIRVVKREQAQEKLKKLIAALSADELRDHEAALREATERFRPDSMSPHKKCKYTKALAEELDAALNTIPRRAEATRLVQGPTPPRMAWEEKSLRSIEEYCDLVIGLPGFEHSPIVAAAVFLSHVVYEAARRRSTPDSIVGLSCQLREFAHTVPNLHGSTRFDKLTPQDLRLAALYNGNDRIQKLPNERLIQLVQKVDGLREEGIEDKDIKTFFVKGCQPRIAELAFVQLSQDIAEIPKERLRDLNLEALDQGKDLLPEEDFYADGRLFDVKCNLYYRSKADKIGLRGFLVKVSSHNPEAELAGFVISGSSDDDVRWSFVGYCRESEVPTKADHRAAPFLFSLPSNLNFPEVEPALARKLLDLLKSADQDAFANSSFGHHDRVALSRSLNARVQGTPLDERALWDEATNELAKLRSQGGTCSSGQRLLNRKREQANSRYWLHRMARINDEPLLCRWIDEVLSPLNKYWDQILCPSCKKKGRIRLSPRRITAAGTVTGELCCQCKFQADNATLITHCWKCEKYPLVIGADGPHSEGCLGLRCECGGCKCNWSAS